METANGWNEGFCNSFDRFLKLKNNFDFLMVNRLEMKIAMTDVNKVNYEKELEKIKHFQMHPELTPFVGENYE